MAKLYVGNLSFGVTDEGLHQLFTSNGIKVESARVITDRDTGRSRGFGFVELGADEDMARAIAQLNGFNLEGRMLQVNEARPQAPRTGGRGGFGGDRGGGGDRGDRGGGGYGKKGGGGGRGRDRGSRY
jgi:RNA recognition motif-containing protein